MALQPKTPLMLLIEAKTHRSIEDWTRYRLESGLTRQHLADEMSRAIGYPVSMSSIRDMERRVGLTIRSRPQLVEAA